VDIEPAVAAFIERQRVARLATVEAAGVPHMVPICFALVEGCVYSVVDEKPKRSTRLQRLRNIAANPNVAVLFDVYSDDWSRLAWVMLRGSAAVLDSDAEHDAAVAALRARYPQYEQMSLENRPVIRIEPERVTTWGDLSF
jgi:PPOX class probable F420-dependent enzyme